MYDMIHQEDGVVITSAKSGLYTQAWAWRIPEEKPEQVLFCKALLQGAASPAAATSQTGDCVQQLHTCGYLGTKPQNTTLSKVVLKWLFLAFFPFPEMKSCRVCSTNTSSQVKNWQLYPLTSTVQIFPVLTHFPVN